MMPTKTEIARAAQLACVDIYPPLEPENAPIPPELFDKVIAVGETVCGLKFVNGVLYIVQQGTRTRPGWMADADIIPFPHTVIGHVHRGFYQNLPALITVLVPEIAARAVGLPGGAFSLPLQVTGHSKGAGEGGILAALLHSMGYNVLPPLLFACPNNGFPDHAMYMRTQLPDGMSFRNCDDFDIGDPVPVVPIFPYCPPYPRTHWDNPPPGWDRIALEDWHHGPLYNMYAQRDALTG
jgi:hypothetical protein